LILRIAASRSWRTRLVEKQAARAEFNPNYFPYCFSQSRTENSLFYKFGESLFYFSIQPTSFN
jgi:hypothetical protein